MIEYGQHIGDLTVIAVIQVDLTQHTKAVKSSKSNEKEGANEGSKGGQKRGGYGGGLSQRGNNEGGHNKFLKVS